jgi:hypothetical protein
VVASRVVDQRSPTDSRVGAAGGGVYKGCVCSEAAVVQNNAATISIVWEFIPPFISFCHCRAESKTGKLTRI